MGMFHIREHLITQIGPVAQSGQGAVPLEKEAQASGASCRGIEARRAR